MPYQRRDKHSKALIFPPTPEELALDELKENYEKGLEETKKLQEELREALKKLDKDK